LSRVSVLLEATTPTHEFTEGVWVVVTYGNEKFPGQVTKCSSNEVQVSCMIKSGRFFRWPERKDEIWYRLTDVKTLTETVIPVTGRGDYQIDEAAFI